MDRYFSSYFGSVARPTLSDGPDVRLQELEAIINNIAEGLVISDADGQLIAMNRSALRMHEYETVEEARRHLSEYSDEFDVSTLDGTPLPLEEWPLARVLQGERFEEMTVRVRRRDTGNVWFGSYNGTPLFDEEGVLVRAVVTIRDITQRHLAQQAVAQARESLSKQLAELDATLASIPDAVYIGTVNGIEWANQEALDQLGYEAVDELNRHIAELGDQIQTRHFATGERIAPEEEPFARALGGESVVKDVVVRHRTSGEDRVVRCAANPIRVDGEVVAAVAVNTDITDRIRTEQALREAKQEVETALRSREEVLATVSHDLRGLASAVALGASMIEDAPQPYARYGELVGNTTQQMQQMIDDLLDVARLQAGQVLSLEIAEVNLNALLEDVAATFALQMQQNDIQFEVHVPDTELIVRADPRRITQVLNNLIGNAHKFTPDGGRVDLSAEARGHEAVVTVADTGPGIAPEDQDHIFEPYWSRASPSGNGTGLGLSISHGLVERHGGEMWVRSVPGEGATLGFTLPLTA